MIARFVLHLEAHRGRWPRLSLRRAPRPGQRVVDGGVPGTLVRCRECGDGLLHAPDDGVLSRPRPAGPYTSTPATRTEVVCGHPHPDKPSVCCQLPPHTDAVLHDVRPGAEPVEVRTATVPDEAARAHPLHAVITEALARPVPGRPGQPVQRIWGRWADSSLGVEGNAWAGTPEDVADLVLRAIAAAPSGPVTRQAWARLRAEAAVSS